MSRPDEHCDSAGQDDVEEPRFQWGPSHSEPAEFEAQEKVRLLFQLRELHHVTAQEEEVLNEAMSMQEAVADKVRELHRMVVQAEAELHDQIDSDRSFRCVSSDDRGFCTAPSDSGASLRTTSLRSNSDENIDGLPPELAWSIAEQRADIEHLQHKKEALMNAMEQAHHEDDVFDGGADCSPSSSSVRVRKALKESEDLERELAQLKRTELRLKKDHHSWADQMLEEVRLVEARATDDRYALKEELALLCAEGEALAAEVEGTRLGMEQVLQRLRHEESELKQEAHETCLLQESQRTSQQSQIQELKALARRLREEEADPTVQQKRRLSTQSERSPKSPNKGSSMRSVRVCSLPNTSTSQDDDASSSGAGPRRLSTQRKPRCSLFAELQAPSGSPRDSEGSAPNASPRDSTGGPRLQVPRGTLQLGVHAVEALTVLQKQAEAPNNSAGSAGSSASSSNVETSNYKPAPGPKLSEKGSWEQAITDQDRITIKLDKKSGDSLGIHIDSELLVTSIERHGLVADWNQSNALSKVCEGYKIVEVNGRKDKKPIVKLLKSDQVLNITLSTQGVSSKRDALRKGRLQRNRATLAGYNCAGAVCMNKDDDEDRRSVASSGDGDNVSVGGSSVASSKPLQGMSSKRLSIIGEDSTVTGDGSSRSSSNAGDDAGTVTAELDAEVRRISLFSLEDEDEATVAEAARRSSLVDHYDALDTMGHEFSQRISTRRTGSTVTDLLVCEANAL